MNVGVVEPKVPAGGGVAHEVQLMGFAHRHVTAAVVVVIGFELEAISFA